LFLSYPDILYQVLRFFVELGRAVFDKPEIDAMKKSYALYNKIENYLAKQPEKSACPLSLSGSFGALDFAQKSSNEAVSMIDFFLFFTQIRHQCVTVIQSNSKDPLPGIPRSKF
jgi:hypothetical protein